MPVTPNHDKKGTGHLNVTLTPSSKRDSMRNSMDFSSNAPSLSMTIGRNSVGFGQSYNNSSNSSSGQYVQLGKTTPLTQYGRF